MSGNFILKDNISKVFLVPRIFIKENYLYDAKNILHINLSNARCTRNYKMSAQDLKNMGFRVKKKSNTHTAQNPASAHLREREHHTHLHTKLWHDSGTVRARQLLKNKRKKKKEFHLFNKVALYWMTLSIDFFLKVNISFLLHNKWAKTLEIYWRKDKVVKVIYIVKELNYLKNL